MTYPHRIRTSLYLMAHLMVVTGLLSPQVFHLAIFVTIYALAVLPVSNLVRYYAELKS